MDGELTIHRQRAPRPASVTVNKNRSRGRYVVLCSVSEAGARRRYRQSFATKREAEDHADAIRDRLRAGLPPFETPEEAAPGFTHADALALYEDEHANDQRTPPRSRQKMIEQRETI